MGANRKGVPEPRLALVRWTAHVGAVTAPSLALYEETSLASARARLCGAARAGLLAASRPLAQAPTLFVVTAAGMRAAGVRGVRPTRVTPANARHGIVCAEVAAALARRFSDHVISGEQELRRDERSVGRALASAALAGGGEEAQLHRPDLVLWPPLHESLPVAVEVELTVKAPRRLLEICIAWARCRCVAGVLYVAASEVLQPVSRAIARAQAGERIVVLPLDALLGSTRTAGPAAPDSPVAGAA